MRKMLEAADLPAPPSLANPEPVKEEKTPPWWMADEALWNPFEVAASVAAIMFWFAFLMGRRNYGFAAELFLPVLWVGVAVVIWQGIARYRAGLPGVFSVMVRRIGGGH